MLDQLYSYWLLFEDGIWGRSKLYVELGIWMEQHSVDADDVAFQLGCAMRQYTTQLGNW